jgi:hypothetical protein
MGYNPRSGHVDGHRIESTSSQNIFIDCIVGQKFLQHFYSCSVSQLLQYLFIYLFIYLLLIRLEESRGSSVNIVTGLRVGRPGFDSRQGRGFFLLATVSRPALRPGPAQPSPAQLPIQRLPGSHSSGVNRPGSDADNSPIFGARLRMTRYTPPLPQYAFMAWYLVKHMDNFSFIFVG